jgi:hypothetical protein
LSVRHHHMTAWSGLRRKKVLNGYVHRHLRMKAWVVNYHDPLKALGAKVPGDCTILHHCRGDRSSDDLIRHRSSAMACDPLRMKERVAEPDSARSGSCRAGQPMSIRAVQLAPTAAERSCHSVGLLRPEVMHHESLAHCVAA